MFAKEIKLAYESQLTIIVPGEHTVYRIMEGLGLSHLPKRKPDGITKADRESRKSDDLLKRDFKSMEQLKKALQT